MNVQRAPRTAYTPLRDLAENPTNRRRQEVFRSSDCSSCGMCKFTVLDSRRAGTPSKSTFGLIDLTIRAARPLALARGCLVNADKRGTVLAIGLVPEADLCVGHATAEGLPDGPPVPARGRDPRQRRPAHASERTPTSSTAIALRIRNGRPKRGHCPQTSDCGQARATTSKTEDPRG